MIRALVLSAALSPILLGFDGCGPKPDTEPPPDTEQPGTDDDGDGWTVEDGDCDDTDPAVNPSALELCDGIDNDCDGTTDDGAVDAGDWLPDGDADGHPADGEPLRACTQPSGWVSAELEPDCDDGDPAIHPDAEETVDGVDNDCDGLIDCEDGDTYVDPACGEAGACLDFTDNDSDGLTDCDDDDCWAECADAPYRAQVSGGQMNLIHQRWWRYSRIASIYNPSIANMTLASSNNTAVVHSATGTLQVLPTPSWSGSPVASCHWSVATATLRYHGYGSDDHMIDSYTLYPAVRAGVTVDPGCGWTSSGFLPSSPAPWAGKVMLLRWWMHGFWGSQDTWYAGAITRSMRTTTSSTWLTGYPSTRTWWNSVESSNRVRSYDIELDDRGDSYPPSWLFYSH